MSGAPSSVDPAEIDLAWEERVLPALSEYTRIPCLSPAFDPEWQAHGHIDAAATLLRQWVDDQALGLSTEVLQLPGRTPVLLVDNGGSGDPIVVYGHMDKQPPLGTWREGLGPYEPVREGHLLFGRGTADDGYATFAAVTALAAADGGAGSRPGAHRGERGERQPRPGGLPRAPARAASARRASSSASTRAA